MAVAEELWAEAEDTVNEYGERDRCYDLIEDYYFMEGDKDPTKKPQAEVEKVVMPHGANVIDLICDLLAQAGRRITVPAPSESKRDRTLADMCELYLDAALVESERDQKIRFIPRAAWWAGMRGALSGRVVPLEKRIKKVGDALGGSWALGSSLPLQVQLRDPRYVYPEFGADGLSYIVERWDRKVRDIRGSYGPELLPDRKAGDIVTWTEYWDSTQFCYWADGKAMAIGTTGASVGPWPHGLGGIPYAYEFARQAGRPEPEKRVRPILKSQLSNIDRMDLLDSMEMTFVTRYIGDVINIYSDELSMEGTGRTYSTASGAMNVLRTDEKVEWLSANRSPLELGDMRGRYAVSYERGTFPGSMFGEDPGRVMAGYAINLLNQSGQARLHPIVACVERTIESLLSIVLMVSENWLSPALDGQRISFYSYDDVEGGDGKVRNVHELDADALNGYYHVEVALGELMPADVQSNVVLAGKLREPNAHGRPLLSDRTILDMFNLAEQGTTEQDRIDEQMAWADEELQVLAQALWVKRVKEEYGRELRELGIDPDELLASRKQAEAQAQAAQQGPPPQAAMPAPPAQAQLPPQLVAQLQQMAMQQQQQQAIIQQLMAQQQAAATMMPSSVMPPQAQGQLMPQPGMEEPGLPPMMPPELQGGM